MRALVVFVCLSLCTIQQTTAFLRYACKPNGDISAMNVHTDYISVYAFNNHGSCDSELVNDNTVIKITGCQQDEEAGTVKIILSKDDKGRPYLIGGRNTITKFARCHFGNSSVSNLVEMDMKVRGLFREIAGFTPGFYKREPALKIEMFDVTGEPGYNVFTISYPIAVVITGPPESDIYPEICTAHSSDDTSVGLTTTLIKDGCTLENGFMFDFSTEEEDWFDRNIDLDELDMSQFMLGPDMFHDVMVTEEEEEPLPPPPTIFTHAYAFRFYLSSKVTIQCEVRICPPGTNHTYNCVLPCDKNAKTTIASETTTVAEQQEPEEEEEENEVEEEVEEKEQESEEKEHESEIKEQESEVRKQESEEIEQESEVKEQESEEKEQESEEKEQESEEKEHESEEKEQESEEKEQKSEEKEQESEEKEQESEEKEHESEEKEHESEEKEHESEEKEQESEEKEPEYEEKEKKKEEEKSDEKEQESVEDVKEEKSRAEEHESKEDEKQESEEKNESTTSAISTTLPGVVGTAVVTTKLDVSEEEDRKKRAVIGTNEESSSVRHRSSGDHGNDVTENSQNIWDLIFSGPTLRKEKRLHAMRSKKRPTATPPITETQSIVTVKEEIEPESDPEPEPQESTQEPNLETISTAHCKGECNLVTSNKDKKVTRMPVSTRSDSLSTAGELMTSPSIQQNHKEQSNVGLPSSTVYPEIKKKSKPRVLQILLAPNKPSAFIIGKQAVEQQHSLWDILVGGSRMHMDKASGESADSKPRLDFSNVVSTEIDIKDDQTKVQPIIENAINDDYEDGFHDKDNLQGMGLSEDNLHDKTMDMNSNTEDEIHDRVNEVMIAVHVVNTVEKNDNEVSKNEKGSLDDAVDEHFGGQGNVINAKINDENAQNLPKVSIKTNDKSKDAEVHTLDERPKTVVDKERNKPNLVTIKDESYGGLEGKEIKDKMKTPHNENVETKDAEVHIVDGRPRTVKDKKENKPNLITVKDESGADLEGKEKNDQKKTPREKNLENKDADGHTLNERPKTAVDKDNNKPELLTVKDESGAASEGKEKLDNMKTPQKKNVESKDIEVHHTLNGHSKTAADKDENRPNLLTVKDASNEPVENKENVNIETPNVNKDKGKMILISAQNKVNSAVTN